MGFPIENRSVQAPITPEKALETAPETGGTGSGAPEAPPGGKRASAASAESAQSAESADWPRWIAVAGGFGYAPVAPGTAGSLLGVIVFLGICALVAPLTVSLGGRVVVVAGFLALLAGLFLLGVWASDRAERSFGRADDGRIVIDEVVGQLIALAPLLAVRPVPVQTMLSQLGPWLVTGFVAFRVFDVWKPGAVRWAERRFDGGLGVMADDVVAGLYAAVVLAVLIAAVPAAGGGRA